MPEVDVFHARPLYPGQGLNLSDFEDLNSYGSIRIMVVPFGFLTGQAMVGIEQVPA
jgi:hypothetical protein